MVSLTLKEVLDSKDAIERVMLTKLPVKVAYRLSKFLSKIQQELNAYDRARTKLITDLGEKDEKTGNIEVKDPVKLADFAKQLKDLQDNTKIEINLDPVKLADIPESAQLAAADLFGCEKFIVE